MQGDLWEGFPEITWEVIEVRTDPNETYIDSEGEEHEFVVYCHTTPIKPILPL